MIGGLIVTHGQLAHELLKAATTIEGDLTGIEAVSLDWNDTVDQARTKIGKALSRFDDGTKVIIFTDMFGGTPSNLCLSFLEDGEVEIVTGVNLPMVVKFASLHSESNDLSDLAHVIRDRGSKAIRVASDFLSGGENGSNNGN